jgi:hypothetical protein
MMTVKSAEYTTWWRCSQNGKNDLQPTQFVQFLFSLWFHMLCSRMFTIEQLGSLAYFDHVTELFKQCQAVLRKNSALQHCYSVIQEIWRLKEPCIFSKEWSCLQWCTVTYPSFIYKVLMFDVTGRKGFSIQCYSSPRTSRKEWPTTNSFNVSCLKLKYLGYNMVVSWSLCHMLGYNNFCKILHFLMSFTRKALHPQKQDCGVIYHVSAKMTQLSLTCLLIPMYILTVSKNFRIWWMTKCWHLVIVNKMGYGFGRIPRASIRVELSLSLTHAHTYHIYVYLWLVPHPTVFVTLMHPRNVCVLASIPVSRHGSATLVTVESAEG